MRVRNEVTLLVLFVSAVGCKKAEGTESPSRDAMSEAREPGDMDPLAELSALEGRMRALGLPIASDNDAGGDAAAGVGNHGEAEDVPSEESPAPVPMQADTVPPAGSPGDTCGDLCSLSDSICTLEKRICSLAEQHPSDAIYADACERAVEDCDVADEACEGCG